jgi:hypothetical protein
MRSGEQSSGWFAHKRGANNEPSITIKSVIETTSSDRLGIAKAIASRASLSQVLLAVNHLRAAENEVVKPRLFVLVVFDQMRGDYLARWQSQFGEGGLRFPCSSDCLWSKYRAGSPAEEDPTNGNSSNLRSRLGGQSSRKL